VVDDDSYNVLHFGPKNQESGPSDLRISCRRWEGWWCSDLKSTHSVLP